MVCEIYIFIRYILKNITYPGLSHSNGIQVSKEYMRVPNGNISKCILEVLTYLDRTLTNSTVRFPAKVGERHDNGEGCRTHDIVGCNDSVIPLR